MSLGTAFYLKEITRAKDAYAGRKAMTNLNSIINEVETLLYPPKPV